ncbi:hypothetical protein CYY_003713 [Polysphondylium violaceum]|uniref:Uncharacterized protein n=1 Tax=Polysphondylium violaceum TaxID=133409 RepID=A0A8J4PY08_9MYCE|nr:hypothetical protein CYY_003713 [Polysphondylium violaceum]
MQQQTEEDKLLINTTILSKLIQAQQLHYKNRTECGAVMTAQEEMQMRETFSVFDKSLNLLAKMNAESINQKYSNRSGSNSSLDDSNKFKFQ